MNRPDLKSACPTRWYATPVHVVAVSRVSTLTCHAVLYATTLFVSMHAIASREYEDAPAAHIHIRQCMLHRATAILHTYSTPATTKVAAWMTADTDVGPSIASGSQLWRPMATLLMDTMLSRSKSTRLPPLTVLTVSQESSVVLHTRTLISSTHTSSTLLYNTLFVLLKVARLLLPQCWMSRKENRPRYSHITTTPNMDDVSMYANMTPMNVSSSIEKDRE